MRASVGVQARGKAAIAGDRAASLLSAWRTGVHLDASDLDELRTILTSSVVLHRRDWAEAVAECPATIVGAGVDLVTSGTSEGPAADVVMSAVLLHSRSGNPAAKLVLDHARHRLANGPD